MNLHVDFDLGILQDVANLEAVADFINITEVQNCIYDVDQITIIFLSEEEEFEVQFYKNEQLVGYCYFDNIQSVLVDSTNLHITFNWDGENIDYSDLEEFIKANIIKISSNEGTSLIVCYRLNDEKDVLNKNLEDITLMVGNFKAPLGIKNIELDVINYDPNNSYNYVYIPKLNRYYYVTNIILTTKDFTRLQLQEDVLMSHKSLILQQDAFVTRYEGSTDVQIVDTRLPVDDVITVQYVKPTNRTTNIINVTLSGNPTGNNILLSTVASSNYAVSKSAVSSPTGTDLPSISGLTSNVEHTYFISKDIYEIMYKANMEDSATASYVNTVLWLPFDPAESFEFDYITDDESNIFASSGLLVGTDVTNAEWAYGLVPPTPPVYPFAYESKLGGSPYLIIADFDFKASSGLSFFGNYLDYEPYSVWEIYIPFAGWQSIQLRDVLDCRLIVYYSLDIHSGNATACLYNVTNKKLIWSGNCQMGVPLAITNTNALENHKQQQGNQLNMIMSLIGSAVSTGIGIAMKNPVSIAGGVMGGTKAIAKSVQSNMMLINKAVTSFGTGDSSLHSPLDVVIRCSYHEKLSSAGGTIYKHLNGLPYNEYVTLSSLTTNNYIEVGDIHFDAKGSNIYTSEIDEIVALLKNGVII